MLLPICSLHKKEAAIFPVALKGKIGGSTVAIRNLIFEELNSTDNCRRQAEKTREVTTVKGKVRYITFSIVMKVKRMDCGT